jgi:5-methylcytosine-specific restriction endonuclease McrA
MSRKTITVVYSDSTRKHIGNKERDELLALGELIQIGPKEYKSSLLPSSIKSSHCRISAQIVARHNSKIGSWFNSRIRQSRNENAVGIHNYRQWIQRVSYFGWRCRYCKIALTLKTLTKDHQIPLARNGSNWAANLVPACKNCNCSKHDRKPSEWRVLDT